MGVRRCLARSLTSLAFRCALQRVQTVPAAIHSGRIPPPQPTSHGDGRLSHPHHHTGHSPFRALIVSNLKWGGPCRGYYVFPQADTKSSAFYKGAMKAYRISRSRKLLVAATRSAPHLTREIFSGHRPADGVDTLGGVFRPGENLALGRRGR